MKKTEYLYGLGFDKKYIKMQKEVCEYKLERIEVLIKHLLKPPHYARDEDRLRAVMKARDWNEEVLRECKEMLSDRGKGEEEKRSKETKRRAKTQTIRGYLLLLWKKI